jgi:enoyl-CoA hydratase
MSTTTTVRDRIAHIRIDEPRGNALRVETIAALLGALGEAERSGAQAVVIEGKERVFCSGLDLRSCSRFTHAEMASYVDAFEGLFERIFSFALPTVAFLGGPAIAGGAVVALACDARVMAPTAEIGLNEVELGIPFPSMAFEIGRFGIPAPAHVDALLLGKRFSAAHALERGIVHEVGSLEIALARAREFLARGPVAVQAVKRALRRDTLERAQARAAESKARWLDAFFASEAQERIGALVRRLESKG